MKSAAARAAGAWPLARRCRAKGRVQRLYHGPNLGPRDAIEHRRSFTTGLDKAI
jgi:hypothetical protein